MTRPMDDDELTEEREVAVLEHRHLPERLQQLSTGARVSQRQRSEGWPMSRAKVKPTNKFMVDRGSKARTFLARCSGRWWSPAWRLMGTSS